MGVLDIICYGGATFDSLTVYDSDASANRSARTTRKFLDGSIMGTIYGGSNASTFFVHLQHGFKNSVKGRANSTSDANQSITYNGVGGCKRRIGFAIKMPPYDGLASSTAGINQAKLKLEVYVP